MHTESRSAAQACAHSLVPVRVITEAGWPVAFREGTRRQTILALVRSWQGQSLETTESGWCIFYEVHVRDRGTVRLILAIQSGSWYLEAPAP